MIENFGNLKYCLENEFGYTDVQEHDNDTFSFRTDADVEDKIINKKLPQYDYYSKVTIIAVHNHHGEKGYANVVMEVYR